MQLRNRKLLSLIVSAAVNTLAKSLTGGKLQPKPLPGIVLPRSFAVDAATKIA